MKNSTKAHQLPRSQDLQSRMYSLWGRLGVFMIALMCSPVWAQAEELRLPKAKEAPDSPKFMMMGVAILLVAGVVAVVTLKTKRGHQD